MVAIFALLLFHLLNHYYTMLIKDNVPQILVCFLLRFPKKELLKQCLFLSTLLRWLLNSDNLAVRAEHYFLTFNRQPMNTGKYILSLIVTLSLRIILFFLFLFFSLDSFFLFTFFIIFTLFVIVFLVSSHIIPIC